VSDFEEKNEFFVSPAFPLGYPSFIRSPCREKPIKAVSSVFLSLRREFEDCILEGTIET
jgi:hypothetical protein